MFIFRNAVWVLRNPPASKIYYRNMADCFNEFGVDPPTNCPASKKNIENNIQKRRIPFHALPRICANLGKSRLTSLVSMTSLGGYTLASNGFDPIVLSATIFGVACCSFCANSLNQYLEYPLDSQMVRTRNRVLPMRVLRPETSVFIGLIFGLIGSGALFAFANNLTAALGISNIILYSFMYTPMKRFSAYNTHVGSLVGSIPPLIGWTAATGNFDLGGLLLASILFSWQFVHFNALSWNLRQDYCKAGYHMMAITNPLKLKNSTILHSLMVLVITTLLPCTGILPFGFSAATVPINLITVYYSIKFAQNSTSKNAKSLFYLSLVQISSIIFFIVLFYAYPLLYGAFNHYTQQMR